MRPLICCALAALSACAQPPALKVNGSTKASATVNLPPGAKRAQILSLHLEGIQPAKGERVIWHIYLDFPEADTQTPAGHPSYVGMVTLLATPRSPQPRSVILPVPAELTRAIRDKASVPLTVVPQPGEKTVATVAAVRLAPVK